jgi:hypothetical protein
VDRTASIIVVAAWIICDFSTMTEVTRDAPAA